jgi:hypothetical protein
MDELTLEEQLLASAYQQNGVISLASLSPFPDQWAAVDDLIDDGYLEPFEDDNGEVIGWRLTEDGEDYVEDEGLVDDPA